MMLFVMKRIMKSEMRNSSFSTIQARGAHQGKACVDCCNSQGA